MHSVRVPINVRCYSNSAIIIRRSAVTLRADCVAKVGGTLSYRPKRAILESKWSAPLTVDRLQVGD